MANHVCSPLWVVYLPMFIMFTGLGFLVSCWVYGFIVRDNYDR